MRFPKVIVLCALVVAAAAGTVKEPIPHKDEPVPAEAVTPIDKVTTEKTVQAEQSPDPLKNGEKTDAPAVQATDSLKNDEKAEEPLDNQSAYQGNQVVRVLLDKSDKEKSKFIKELADKGEISTWMSIGTTIDVVVKDSATLEKFKAKDIKYEVMIEDLQRAIEEENPKLSEDEWDELVGRKGYRLTWQMYHRMNDIHDYMDYLAATYPNNVTITNIGKSIEGRPLRVLEFKSGEPNRPAIWVDSGIHAREWITPASLTYIMSQMIEGGDGSRNVDWYFNPLVNPDGYEHSHTRDRLWRKNRAHPEKGSCAGIDLNRNFGYKWGGQGASKQPCRETFAGSGPFSEPETAAIQRFISSKQGQIKGYVSLHSYGQYILYPWGYDRKVPQDYQDLERVGRAMAAAIRSTGGQTYTVGSAATTLYPAAGGSDDWAKGGAKIKYAYTVELRDTGRHGFVLPASYIVPTAKDAYAALDVLAKEIGK